ncbi:molybdopterin-dependent oxidoreductase [Tellurirhabdus bombi]|uniref:molybdopterin-dependent oxidoreductase n=1 Tax=Tellurirhabdus bombi TaxID=2907205 RepID=UPI001F1785E5|nr:molybdopterin-dependent oxidoreductase [Tellurirhabdus bombi]
MENKIPENNPRKETDQDLTPDQQIRRRTLKAFAWFGLASLVPVGVWKWIKSRPREAGLPKPFRRFFTFNEQLDKAYFSPQHLAPTFPKSMAAKKVRVNGYDGLKKPIDLETWRLQVEQPTPNGPQKLALTLADLQTLPKQEIIFEFKCIEGWSQIQHWGGVRLIDFMTKYKLGTRNGTAPDLNQPDALYSYVGMKTPDNGYYVGIDMASALHPQTLLAYEMNGEPLTNPHGAPLRLLIPVKYGVKNLKRIGEIWFSDSPPRDFWAERGYDYHIGL